MIIEQMSIVVPQGKRQQLGSALASFVGPTQVQPGCLSSRLFESWANHCELCVETRWASEAELIHHLRSDAYRQLLQLMELSSTPPVIEFFAVVRVQGLELVQSARQLAE